MVKTDCDPGGEGQKNSERELPRDAARAMIGESFHFSRSAALTVAALTADRNVNHVVRSVIERIVSLEFNWIRCKVFTLLSDTFIDSLFYCTEHDDVVRQHGHECIRPSIPFQRYFSYFSHRDDADGWHF